MSLTNPNTPVSQQDLKDFYDKIKPYMGLYPSAMGKMVGKGDIYSTEERLIGQWIDGKPLYQFVYKGLTPTTANSWVKIIDFSTMNVDYIVSARVFTTEHHDDTYNYYQEVPYHVSNDCYVYIGLDDTSSAEEGVQIMNDHDIYVRVGNARAGNSDICVIVQYTKTTDSAISIGDETDYSTDEKIVGTWIDGKPIWQKTFVFNNPSTDWGLNSFNITNANMLISVPQVIFNDNNIPYVRNDNGEYENLYVNKDGARIRTNQSITKLTITIQYTKTT